VKWLTPVKPEKTPVQRVRCFSALSSGLTPPTPVIRPPMQRRRRAPTTSSSAHSSRMDAVKIVRTIEINLKRKTETKQCQNFVSVLFQLCGQFKSLYSLEGIDRVLQNMKQTCQQPKIYNLIIAIQVIAVYSDLKQRTKALCFDNMIIFECVLVSANVQRFRLNIILCLRIASYVEILC